jgi:hypothetical protein
MIFNLESWIVLVEIGCMPKDFVEHADAKIATKDYVEPLHPGMNES